MSGNSIALVNASRIYEGMFPGNIEYLNVLRTEGYRTSWYQCIDSPNVSDFYTEENKVYGSRFPITTVSRGINRFHTYPSKLRDIPESVLILLDPTIINIGNYHSKVAVKVHDLRPLTQYRDLYATRIMFRYLIPKLRKQKYLIATTEHSKKELTSIGVQEENVHIVPEPSPIPFIRGHIEESIGRISEQETITVAYIASPRKYKNIEFFVALAKKVGEECERFRFLMISRLDSQKKSEMGIEGIKNLRLIEKVPDIRNVYESTDILLHPSHYEGFGRPIIEAMRFGIPTIANDIQPLKEIIGDAGLLVPADSVDRWAESLHFLSTPRNYRKYAERSFRRAVDVYSPDNFRESLLKLVENILSSGF